MIDGGRMIEVARPMFELALAKHRKGRLKEAAVAYTRILALVPTYADCHHMLSVLSRQAGQNEMAMTALRKAIACAPREVGFRQDLLEMLHERGDTRGQLAALQEMCLLWPDQASLHTKRGMLLRDAGRHAEAAECFRWALSQAPEDADTHCLLGLSQRELGQPEAASASFRAAIQLRPDSDEAHNNLGSVLMSTGQFAAAEQSFQEALRLGPDRSETRLNMGTVARILGRNEEAEACYRGVLAERPDYAEAHYSLGWLLMITGRLDTGWAEQDWRMTLFPQRNLGRPLWNGEPLNGRTVLLHADQGFGDALQFCRFVPEIARHNNVILEVPKWLAPLMRSLGSVGSIVERDATLPYFDVQCPLTRLGLVAGVTLDTLPGPVPYLQADADAVAAWRQRLAQLPGLRVGLVWAGNPNHLDDRRRSIALHSLTPLATVPNVTFVSLQKVVPDGVATPPFGMTLHDWTAELRDFADTAALVTALDLVIAVDTAVVHLAGALGKPVWLLNRFDTCWRWLQQREDSPWYPTLRQFRQTDPTSWDAPILAMRDALAQLAADPDRLTHGG